MRYLLLILIATGFAFVTQLASAAPRSIKDCEKIKAADAYNRCLASFGPVAHQHILKPVPTGASSGRHHHYHVRRHRHRHGFAHSRHSHRKQMTISVGTHND